MVPFISVQSQKGKIGIHSERGQYEIRRPQPVLNISSRKPEIIAHNRPGQLNIDNSRTWEALDGGNMEVFWSRIYSQYKQIAQQNISEIVAQGNQLGDLRIKGNPIPDMALDEFIEGAPDLQVYGEASVDNTQFNYIPNDPDIQFVPGELNVQAQIQRPDINFHRGSVNIYMEQYPKVTITPPVIDISA
ncbi:DUF6470 family protein [Cohnella yongneupensis]|uniref:DUF6470 family protein n=1 Tax=Cohnella yongneupensis TaxID=425006 RepID=A0ABW0QW18_9BACL